MTSSAIRKKFLSFFEERGHAVVASSSLVPDDPSVLLTTAGMQQFKRYYTGELDAQRDFGSRNATSIQKSFRTSDIDEVGDETHLTFFEMMGNFSFGGYWKKEAIAYAHAFIVKELGLQISYATVFKGSGTVPKDEESKKIWNELGVNDVREEGMEDVFWGPTGNSGPCGPTTEIYCKNANGRDVEIWNIVFNEFFCSGSREELLAGRAKLSPLATKGIDTGMGLERLAMIAQGTKTIFDTDLFAPLTAALPSADTDSRRRRIIADHARGSYFLISDGVTPSNKDQGYVLRRLLRRMIVQTHAGGKGSFAGMDTLSMGIAADIKKVFGAIHADYHEFYPELDLRKVEGIFDEEFARFNRTFRDGVREIRALASIDAPTAFRLYGSFGITYEITKDIAGEKAAKLTREAFDGEFRKHQELSRAGAEKKFGGHGLILDTGELKAGDEEELKKVLRLHTATHLLQSALREVLGPEVHQMGSDITPERTRFDFSFPRKMLPDEIRKVEEIVNAKIREDLQVSFKEMSKDEAAGAGALHFFKEKYPERVKVYFVGKDLASAWSKEFCGGPHVAHTGEIGHFRIAKEEAVGAGIRRVRGMVD